MDLHILIDWFTGGSRPYHDLVHCMAHDHLWVTITVVLDLAVACGYAVIAGQWWRNERLLGGGPSKKALRRLKQVFLVCGLCGYLFIPIKMVWPAWRLYDIVMVLLVYSTWRYAWGARGLAVVYTELGRAERLAHELQRSRTNQELLEGRVRELSAVERMTAALRESEEKYRTLIASIPDVTWRSDRTGRTTFISPNVEQIIGFTAEEVTAAGEEVWLGRIHPDDLARVLAAYKALFDEGRKFDAEYRFQHRRGNWVWVHDRASRTQAVGADYADGIFTDITPRKAAEQALIDKTGQLEAIGNAMAAFLQDGDWRRASATVLRSALEQTQSAYGFVGVVVGGALRVLAHEGVVWSGTVNRRFYEEALRTYSEVGYLEFANFKNLFGRVIVTGEPLLSNDVTGDSRAGGNLPAGHPPLRSFLGVPIRNGHEVVGMIGIANRADGYSGVEQTKIEILTQAAGVLYDSYRRRVQQVELEAQRRRAEQAERERTHFKEAVAAMEQVLGVVGHELRTPIAGMRAISEVLLTEACQQSGEFDRFLTQLNEESVRMAETVDELLEAARLNSGQARWNWSTVPLAEVCNEALGSIRALVDAQRVQVTFEVEPTDGAMRGDADAIRRLLINLANNARKHTPQGCIHISVKVRREADASWVDMTVVDNGSGMAAEILEKLGEAFALNSGIVGATGISGTGLGLAICNGIAAAHGGEISVDSTLGQGTKVVARLRADLPGPPVGSQGKSQFVTPREEVRQPPLDRRLIPSTSPRPTA